MSPPRVLSIVFLLPILFNFSIFVDAFPSNVDSNQNDQADEDWSKLTECNDFLAAVKRSSNSYRRCILDRIRVANTTFERAVNACSSTAPWRCLDIRRLPGHHYAIPPPPPSHSIVDAPPAECLGVFIGRNAFVDMGDILLKDITETGRPELLDLAPGCRLHLAYPFDHRNFTPIGQHHPVSVYISPSRIEKPFLCDVAMSDHYAYPDLHDGVVDTTCVEIKLCLETLDDTQKKPSYIDYLWIDSIWPDRSAGNGLITDRYISYSILTDEPRGVTICQIVIEDSSDSGSTGIITNVLEKSGFIPLRSQSRQLWLNVASPYCIAKFIAPRFEVTSCGRMATVRNEKAISGQFEIDAELIRVE